MIPEIEPLITKLKPIILIETGGENRLVMISFLKEIGYWAYELETEHLKPANFESGDDILFVHEAGFQRIQTYLEITNLEQKVKNG